MKSEGEDNFSDLEAALSQLRPVELSQDFFDAVEARLEADETCENTVAFPRFSFLRIAGSVALLAGAVGVGFWVYSNAENERSREASVAVADDFARDEFQLVNIERRWNSQTSGDVVHNEDGSFSRNVRYSYMDEYCWKNEDSGAVFVELRPYEEVVSMEVPVY